MGETIETRTENPLAAAPVSCLLLRYDRKGLQKSGGVLSGQDQR